MIGDRLLDRAKEPFFALAHDDIGFGKISGHAEAIEIGSAGERTARVPGTPGATDWSMHDVRGVANRQQRDLRAVERASSLRRAGLRLGATGLRLVVVAAGGLVLKSHDLGLFHAAIPVLER
jgi:hypothetical protein